MKKVVLFVIIIAILIAGIVGFGVLKSNKSQTPNKKVSDKPGIERIEETYSLKLNDKDVNLGSNFLDLNLDKPDNVYEAESCAFDGIEKTYTYPDFEIMTRPVDDKEEILSVYFLTDALSTNEGLKIGDSIDKVIETYGEDCEKTETSYIYKKENTSLSFIIEENVVTGIEYTLSTLNN